MKVFLISMLMSAFALSQDLVVGITGDYIPMMFPSGSAQKGIYIDIIEQVAQRNNLSVAYKDLPPGVRKRMFNKGQIDVEPGVNPVWRKSEAVPGEYSVEFMKSEDVILFREGKNIPVKTPKDLAGRTLGVVKGYFYPGFMELFQDQTIKAKGMNGEKLLMDALANGSIDQIIINKAIAEYYKKVDPRFKTAVIGDVVGDVNIMFRVHPTKKNLIPNINKTINDLKSSGDIDKIIGKYR